MVESRVSGILFTANPTTRDRGESVVSAGLGLGEGVVGDLVESDTYFLDGASGAVRERVVSEKRSRVAFDRARGGGTEVVAVDAKTGDAPALTDAELGALAAVGRKIEAARGGAPQDIEWAIDGGATLYVLQTRPITTLAAAPERETVFDNSNVVESYPGLSSPLTFTFALRSYEGAFREAQRRLGTSERAIEENRAVHENLLALVDGRIYYNIGNWYRIFEMLPGLEGAIPAWEQALGLRKRFARAPAPPSLGTRLRRLPGVLAVVRRMIVRFVMLDRDVRRFQERFAAVHEDFKRRDLAALGPHELFEFYERLARVVMPGYAVSIVNDFFTQQLYALVGKLIDRYRLGDAASLRNDLLCGETGMESVAPVHSILGLTEMIRADPKLRAVVEDENEKENEILEKVRRDPAFGAFCERLDRHLELYGDRTLHELKLETPLMADDPGFLVAMFRNYLRGGQDVSAMERREGEIRGAAEAALARGLAGRPVRGRLFRFVLRNSRKTVRHRENLRLLRSRAFGMVKRIFREIGRHFTEAKLIDAPADIFWLAVEEVAGTIRGHAITRDLRALVAMRKKEWEGFKKKTPAGRIVARGIAYANDLSDDAASTRTSTSTSTELRGIGCSPGKVSGKAKVILSPEQDMRIQGEILVAPMTDPGWVFLMVAAGGIVSEKGSLLSHTAIIGRELGIPTVVGVKDATKRIADGAVVELDGQAGVVRLVGPTPDSASPAAAGATARP